MSIESLCIREKRNDPVSETTRKIQARALQCLKKYDASKGDDCETKTFSSLAEEVANRFDDAAINAFYDFATLLCGRGCDFESMSQKSELWAGLGDPNTFRVLASFVF